MCGFQNMGLSFKWNYFGIQMGGEDFKRCNFTLEVGSALSYKSTFKVRQQFTKCLDKTTFVVAKSKMRAELFDKCQSEMLILMVPLSCP